MDRSVHEWNGYAFRAITTGTEKMNPIQPMILSATAVGTLVTASAASVIDIIESVQQ
ncbi:MAG: hypothetical protein WCA45_11855 [Thiobacillaceae bacterium]